MVREDDRTARRSGTIDAVPAIAPTHPAPGRGYRPTAGAGQLGAAAGPADPADRADRAVRGAVRTASPLAVAGIVANTANLLVTLVLARHLDSRSYGALAQLLALFFVASMPGSALLVGVVRKVTAWQQAGRAAVIDQWVTRVRRIGIALVALTGIVGLLLRDVIAAALSLPGPGGVAEMLTAGAAWCLLCIDRGLLQSACRYPGLAANLLIEGLSRSVLAVLLVLAGFGEAGVALAILLGVLIGLGHARRVLAQATGRHRTDPGPLLHPASPGSAVSGSAVSGSAVSGSAVSGSAVSGQTHDAQSGGPRCPGTPPNRLAVEFGAALTALVLLGVLQNVDVLVIGAHRSPDAGSYAAVSVACKALVFAAVVLGGFLLPETVTRRHHGQHALAQLGATLAILAVPALGLIGIALTAPRAGLALAFGQRLTTCAAALAPLAGAMACLGVTVLFTHYLLAVGARGVLLVLAAATALAIPLMLWAHGRPMTIVYVELALHAALAAGTGLLVLSTARPTARPRPRPRPAGRRVPSTR
ncbi:hypothetical protein [Frankia sp. Cppng1_Ct_nod]|uniref:hypothetical protein n=1 Tax=Frankia sp. Cppng1_Ct_nod TaxID=2897162 RepID=UPI0013EF8613|nr:hypothetical protein [Frankia sp. Cppng1_Ct_nod]